MGRSFFANVDTFWNFLNYIFIPFNPVKYIFLRRLACHLKKAGENKRIFWGDWQQLALMAYPDESQGAWDQLAFRGSLKRIHHSQHTLELRKSIWDQGVELCDRFRGGSTL